MICKFNTAKYFLGVITQHQGKTSMLLSQRVQNQMMLLKTSTCQTFVCVLSQYPKRKDEQGESGLLPLLPAGLLEDGRL